MRSRLLCSLRAQRVQASDDSAHGLPTEGYKQMALQSNKNKPFSGASKVSMDGIEPVSDQDKLR